jgi:hypothetical protein
MIYLPRTKRNFLHPTTLILLSFFGVAGLIVLAWLTGQETISNLFQQLDQLQQNPPMWLDVPMQMGHFLFGWEVLLLVGVIDNYADCRTSRLSRYWNWLDLERL